jgi:hypothetical protein
VINTSYFHNILCPPGMAGIFLPQDIDFRIEKFFENFFKNLLTTWNVDDRICELSPKRGQQTDEPGKLNSVWSSWNNERKQTWNSLRKFELIKTSQTTRHRKMSK